MSGNFRDPSGALRALHVRGSPLVLPNVWDVTSALAVAEAGYPALATLISWMRCCPRGPAFDGTWSWSLLNAALIRARRYAAAGADCEFPILLHDPVLAAEFCRLSPLPVNLLGSYVPTTGRIGLADAAEAGAARVSFGPDLWLAANRALEVLIPPIT